jgi:hypothetical protein
MFWNADKAIVWALFTGRNAGSALQNAVSRVFISNLDDKQLHFLLPNTFKVYETWMQRISAKPVEGLSTGELCFDAEVLDNGFTKLLWLGKRKTTGKVVLFCHGRF